MTVYQLAKAKALGVARKAVAFVRRNGGKIVTVTVLGTALLKGSVAHAQTDQITQTISSVSGYETAAVAVGVAVLLFVIGRKVVRKLI